MISLEILEGVTLYTKCDLHFILSLLLEWHNHGELQCIHKVNIVATKQHMSRKAI